MSEFCEVRPCAQVCEKSDGASGILEAPFKLIFFVDGALHATSER